MEPVAEPLPARVHAPRFHRGWAVTAGCFLIAIFAWGTVFYGRGFYIASLTRRHGGSTSAVSGAVTLFWVVGIPMTVITGGIIDAKFFGVLAMFGAIFVMVLVPWLDTSRVRSGKYRPQFRWWFYLLVIDFIVLTWAGAMPAQPPYSIISLIGATYWFAYFLVILPILGVIEKPTTPPATIEDDFNAHYGKPAE